MQVYTNFLSFYFEKKRSLIEETSIYLLCIPSLSLRFICILDLKCFTILVSKALPLLLCFFVTVEALQLFFSCAILGLVNFCEAKSPFLNMSHSYFFPLGLLVFSGFYQEIEHISFLGTD